MAEELPEDIPLELLVRGFGKERSGRTIDRVRRVLTPRQMMAADQREADAELAASKLAGDEYANLLKEADQIYKMGPQERAKARLKVFDKVVSVLDGQVKAAIQSGDKHRKNQLEQARVALQDKRNAMNIVLRHTNVTGSPSSRYGVPGAGGSGVDPIDFGKLSNDYNKKIQAKDAITGKTPKLWGIEAGNYVTTREEKDLLVNEMMKSTEKMADTDLAKEWNDSIAQFRLGLEQARPTLPDSGSAPNTVIHDAASLDEFIANRAKSDKEAHDLRMAYYALMGPEDMDESRDRYIEQTQRTFGDYGNTPQGLMDMTLDNVFTSLFTGNIHELTQSYIDDFAGQAGLTNEEQGMLDANRTRMSQLGRRAQDPTAGRTVAYWRQATFAHPDFQQYMVDENITDPMVALNSLVRGTRHMDRATRAESRGLGRRRLTQQGRETMEKLRRNLTALPEATPQASMASQVEPTGTKAKENEHGETVVTSSQTGKDDYTGGSAPRPPVKYPADHYPAEHNLGPEWKGWPKPRKSGKSN